MACGLLTRPLASNGIDRRGDCLVREKTTKPTVNTPDGVADQSPSNVAIPGQAGAEASVPGQDRPGPQVAAAVDRVLNPSLTALVVWLVCLPVAFMAVRLLRPGDPFSFRTALIPVAVGAVVLAVTAVITRRRKAEVVSGLAAGLLAGWVAFTMRLALNGTPYGFWGLGGDGARMAGMANRYVTAWRSSDGIVSTVPSQYPPLFPWVVGHTAALVHVPALAVAGAGADGDDVGGDSDGVRVVAAAGSWAGGAGGDADGAAGFFAA